jgi:3-phosphoshikimate 1-carboxyvinyltransferase
VTVATEPGHAAPAPLPDRVRVSGAVALAGEVRTPGDKSISHRALLVGALGEGTSTIRGLSDGEDVRHTMAAVASLGAEVHEDGPTVTVRGGRSRLRPPPAPIDCGNSGTGMRLMAGLVAGMAGETVLMGDESLSGRPMDRVAAPLAAMGATVLGTGERCLPPLTIKGGDLTAVEWTPPTASAQVKSAILLAGLSAEGETVVREEVRTRAHTEELLARAGAAITVAEVGGGRVVRLWASLLRPLDLTVPGDPSQAAFWVVAACLVEGSAVTVRGVYAGAERIGFVHVLRRMGGDVELSRPGGGGGGEGGAHGAGGGDGGAHGAGGGDGGAHGAGGEAASAGTPVADVRARFRPLSATTVLASEIPSLDEVPALAVAAAAATGTSRFVGMAELRVKETDRLRAVAELVEATGAAATIEGDDLIVHGAGRLRHFGIDSRGDHRMAMAAAVAALAAGPGESRIAGFASVATSYPGFLADLRALGGRARVPLVAIDGPAGSGKSTVSKALATRLGIDRLDTGAMYRAIAWAALERGVDPADGPAVAAIARGAEIDAGPEAVVIDGRVVTEAIRTPGVNRAVSAVAANPEVRTELVKRQRAWGASHDGGVVEGRDIGTVVFPTADLKVFLTASADERARRRYDEAADAVARRDRIDSTRAASPLAKADDAHLLDTTGRSVGEVVEQILSWL